MSSVLLTASLLNSSHACLVLDDAMLDTALRAAGADFAVEDIVRNTPHLFSRAAVFVDHETGEAMRAVVAAVERVVRLPAYRALAFADAPALARLPVAQRGAFLGFDFHLSSTGPQLIEINTNAGGGLLNATLRRGHRVCCEDVLSLLRTEERPPVDAFYSMFLDEWRLARGEERALRTVAIVDDAPETQYLYPEFQLFEAMLRARGLSVVVCDAAELTVRDGKLVHGELAIDLVYNRLTDFGLDDPRHAALSEAYRNDLSVITPHPAAHALYADKLRLCTLSDADALHALGVAEGDVATLIRHVPRTMPVHAGQRDELWSQRKQLFFKPRAGYGSKATYRGDKLTTRVFEEQILREPYIAQRLVPPSSRVVRVGHTEERTLKVDIRNFAYDGNVQLVCARLYEGQTTNFRTAGGGFAPVFETLR